MIVQAGLKPHEWEVIASVHRTDVQEESKGFSRVITSEEQEANAHLIAAAPDLLEVMKRALKLSREHSDFKLYAMQPFWDAIAKAEGRT